MGRQDVPPTPTSPLPGRPFVGLLVFGSGLCALVYQTAWQREFRLIFGASTAASAAVVAVFMGGLGLGGFVLGRRVDRHPNPLRLYAQLEAIVAASALATPFLLSAARSAYLALGGTSVLGVTGGTAVRLLLAALVLIVPTFVAGGTLGAAARAVEADGGRRRRTALLYGLNTLGAVAGCLLATFWLFEALGTRRTLWAAAALNLAIAAVGVLLSRAAPAAPAAEAPVAEAAPAPPWFVLASAGVVGFAFFLMELVWYRMLGPILGGTVYTFGLILAVALAGVAVGGLLYPLIFRRRVATLGAFAATCLLEAAAVALPFVLGDSLALAAAGLRPPPGSPLSAYLPGWTTVSLIAIAPAAVLAGVQFPILLALLGSGRTRVAQHIGRAYACNTAGAIVGALAGGFGLVPLLGAPLCWAGVAVLLGLLACAAAVAGRLRGGRLAAPLVATAALGVLLLAADGPTAVWRHSSIGVGRANAPLADGPNELQRFVNEQRRAIVWEADGVESSVAVQDIAALSFVVNGKVDGNARNDAPTQVMSGLLGALLHPGARRSMVIGLGTGSTAGWLATVPGMERTDVVELEPAILRFARECAPVNQGAMDNPRIVTTIGDAREVLTAGRGRYDLVFSEPSNPYRAGVAGLFTREFYEAAGSRIDRDGIFLQWVQAYDVDDWTVSTVMATLSSVFPHVELWHVHQADMLLVASFRPLRVDVDAWRARIREEPFRTALPGVWRATEAEDVLARFVAGPAFTRTLAASVRDLNTDDRNLVEFAFARSLSRSQLFDLERVRREAAAMGAGRPDVSGRVDWDRVARQRVAIQFVAGTPPTAAADASEAQRIRTEAVRLYLTGELAQAARKFREQPEPPQGLVETTVLAEGLAELGDPAAVEHIRVLREHQPTEAEAATARLALRVGNLELAVAALVSSLTRYRTDPWAGQVAMSHALGLADELTLTRGDLVPVVFEALSQPFSMRALEEPRRLFLLSVGSHGGQYRCEEVLAPLEPHVPWRGDVLRYRARCYAKARDGKQEMSRADLQRFERQERQGKPPASPKATPPTSSG